MVTKKNRGCIKRLQGRRIAARPGTNPFAVPGGPRIAAPAVICMSQVIVSLCNHSPEGCKIRGKYNMLTISIFYKPEIN